MEPSKIGTAIAHLPLLIFDDFLLAKRARDQTSSLCCPGSRCDAGNRYGRNERPGHAKGPPPIDPAVLQLWRRAESRHCPFTSCKEQLHYTRRQSTVPTMRSIIAFRTRTQTELFAFEKGGIMSLRNARIFYGAPRFVLAFITSFVLVWALPADGHVKKIVIDKKVSPAFDGASFGPAGQYETLAGRAFGELDPNDSHNTIITDIKLAPRNANGKVEYIASFYLVKPIDMSKSSHLMWQDVPNRGGRITIAPAQRNGGDIGLKQRMAGRQFRSNYSGRR